MAAMLLLAPAPLANSWSATPLSCLPVLLSVQSWTLVELSFGILAKSLKFLRLSACLLCTLRFAGLDSVEFLFAAGPAEPLRPLSAVASGGESARIMLALKAAPSLVGRAAQQAVGTGKQALCSARAFLLGWLWARV